jgi:hypothetical protein
LKSLDGGATWQSTGLVNTGISALAVDPSDPRIVYAATGRVFVGSARQFQGLFKSIDGGTNWTPVNSGLTFLGTASIVTAVAIDSDDSNSVYLATSGDGIWRSVDGGGTWSPLNDGLLSLDIRSLALVPGTPNTLYAATPAGVFAIIDNFPVLSLESRLCVGVPWTVRLSHGPAGVAAKLRGNSNGDPWEVSNWQVTDTDGRFSTSGTFGFETIGRHLIRVEIAGLLSNSVVFRVSDCPGNR